ncbi:MAG: ribonuclease III [Phycisphaerales bacterium]|nr:ribonuclease III [Phycisphaerales bacterium]
MVVSMRARAESLLGYSFDNPELLQLALTHSSRATSRQLSNERLEFLGDAVLGLCICEHLYLRFPQSLEGDLTKLKSLIVSRKICAQIATERGYLELLQSGKGMSRPDQMPASVAAAIIESLIGAVYLDSGLDAARSIVVREFGPFVERFSMLGHHENFKSVLQQMALALGMGSPEYKVLDEKGPDHALCFEVCVELGARRFEACWGMSKRVAEQAAARCALIELGMVVVGEDGVDRVESNNGLGAQPSSKGSKASTAASGVKAETSKRRSAKRR